MTLQQKQVSIQKLSMCQSWYLSYSEGKIIISNDVTFYETCFPYSNLFPSPTNSPPITKSQSSLPITTFSPCPTLHSPSPTHPNSVSVPSVSEPIPPLTNPIEINTNSHPLPGPTDNNINSTNPTETNRNSAPPTSPSPSLETISPSSIDPSSPLDLPPTKIHPMVTRSQTGSLKPKVFLAHTESTTTKQALSDPILKTTMELELKALHDNNIWTLTMWVYRIKENPDGSVSKYKA